MEQLKTSLTELIETKVEDEMKTTSANVEDTYTKLVARSIPKKLRQAIRKMTTNMTITTTRRVA